MRRALVAFMSKIPSKSDQLERRLICFAATIVSLSAKLPRTPQGRHICKQILRSGTSAAANYGEARGAESRSDFIHKLKVVFKELTRQPSGLRSSRKPVCFPSIKRLASLRKIGSFAE